MIITRKLANLIEIRSSRNSADLPAVKSSIFHFRVKKNYSAVTSGSRPGEESCQFGEPLSRAAGRDTRTDNGNFRCEHVQPWRFSGLSEAFARTMCTINVCSCTTDNDANSRSAFATLAAVRCHCRPALFPGCRHIAVYAVDPSLRLIIYVISVADIDAGDNYEM